MRTLLVVLLCVPFFTSAQQEKGTYYISLNNPYKSISYADQNLLSNSGISFGNETYVDYTIDGDRDYNGTDYWMDNEKIEFTNFNIGCEFGYFVFNQMLIGGAVDYSYFNYVDEQFFKIDLDDQDDYELYEEKGYSFGFSPFARYYFKTKIPLFISSKYAIGKSMYDWNRETEYTSEWADEDFDDIIELFTNRIVIGTGVSILLSDKIFLEPSFNYSFNRYRWIEEEELINQSGIIYMDDRDHMWKTRSYYINIAASYYF